MKILTTMPSSIDVDQNPFENIPKTPFDAICPAIEKFLSPSELKSVEKVVKRYSSAGQFFHAVTRRPKTILSLNKHTKTVLCRIARFVCEYSNSQRYIEKPPVTNESINDYMYQKLKDSPFETVCVMLVDDELHFLHGQTVDVKFTQCRKLCWRIRKLTEKHKARLVYIGHKRPKISMFPSSRDKFYTQKIRRLLLKQDLLFEGSYFVTEEKVLPIYIYANKK